MARECEIEDCNHSAGFVVFELEHRKKLVLCDCCVLAFADELRSQMIHEMIQEAIANGDVQIMSAEDLTTAFNRAIKARDN